MAGTRALVRAARSEQLTFIAASLAYYAFVSLFPLLLLVLVAASVFGGPEFADALAVRTSETVAPAAGEFVYDTLVGADVRGGATVVGVAVLVWSGLKVFRGLDIAFSQVYGADTDESFLRQVRDAVVALLAVGGGVAIVVAAGTIIARSGVRFVGVLATPALVVGLTAALLPLYYLFPDTDVTLREAFPGAVLAATGWALLGTVFRLYTENAGNFEGYGIVGAVLLLVTWFYVGSIVLLLGAVVNAVLAGRLDEGEIPAEHPTRERPDAKSERST